MEKYLRLALANQASSQIRVSCTVTGIEEDSENVYCYYSDASKGNKGIRAKFLVGADGKTGFTREKCLEPKGILLERSSK
jgi:2-polyprenyl-6-methoxyphenol hydroxylase-like FAD-dependent oxidoreductase